tara:strand:- start:3195 stop:5069 length:1875 start_codon:yes stop_codon:yes gene_type:complete
MADTTQAQLDAQIFGDPRGFLDPIWADKVANVTMDPYAVPVWGGKKGAQALSLGQRSPWGGYSKNPSELERSIDMADILFAGGDITASDYGWESTVDTGDIPGHAMSSDDYGMQAGLKSALRKQANPLWSSGFTNLLHTVRAESQNALHELNQRYNLNLPGGTPVHKQLLPSKRENTRRAIDAYNEANPQRGFLAPLAAGTIPAGGLTGKALNQWLREGNILQANTPSGIGPLPKPGDPDFRGFTAKDVPKTKFGDYVQDAKNITKRALRLSPMKGGFLSHLSPLALGVSAAFHSPDLGDSYVEDLDTLQPFNFTPQFEEDLDRTSSIRSPLDGFGSPIKDIPEGTFAPYQGPLGDPPAREDWFPQGSIENQNTLLRNTIVPISTGSGIGGIIEDGVQTDFAPRDVMPVVTGPEDFEPVMPDASIPFDPADESEVSGTFDSTTPGLIGDYLRAQEQDFILPSGPEEMTEVFTEEDKVAEDEQKRINEIAAQAEQDRIRLEKQAEDARRKREADERQAKKLRDQAEKADENDRQYRAKKMREAEAKERQAREKRNEERQATEAARLNALAAAAKQQNLANERRQREEQARKQAEFDRQHEEFIKQMDRDWRARQQASMPKSWAFF